MEAGEMAQQLRANTALAEDLNLVPGTLIGQLTAASTPIPGDLPPSSGSRAHRMHTTEK